MKAVLKTTLQIAEEIAREARLAEQGPISSWMIIVIIIVALIIISVIWVKVKKKK